MLKVNNIVIHEIKKEEGSVETHKTSFELSENNLVIGQQETEMVTELEKKYSSLPHTTAKFGYNSTISNQKIPEYLKQYQKKENPKFDFLAFTKEATKNFKLFIESSAPAKGGYLIFVEYEKDLKRIFAIFFVRNKKGSSFQFDKTRKVFTISPSIHVDVEHLAMAARVNLSLFEVYSGNERYLTFINKSHQDSQYFLKWFCADDTLNSKEDTYNLRKILAGLGVPKDNNGEDIIELSEFMNNIHAHVKSKNIAGQIDLKILGKVFYNDEDKLTKYADENNIIINTVFQSDKDEIKKLISINVKAEKIGLNFPIEYIYQGLIRIEGDNIIIKSSKLVSLIKKEQVENE